MKLVLGKSAKAGAPYLAHISLCRQSLCEIGTTLFSNVCDILLGFRLFWFWNSFFRFRMIHKSIVQHLKGYSCGIGRSNNCLKLVVTFVSLFAWTVWRRTHYKMFPHLKCHTFLILQAKNISGRKSLCESVSFIEFKQIFLFWS